MHFCRRLTRVYLLRSEQDRSESYVSYYAELRTTLEVDIGDMTIEGKPSYQYPIFLYLISGSLVKWCLT